MPRRPRTDAPGAIHHVMARGVDRMAIFRDDTDRARLIDQLRRVAREERTRVLAWALMPNHLHLVAQTGPKPGGISRVMARVGTAHAQAINRRHGRVGHLFQDRFRSILVESDTHLRWLVRYVHRNPIEAGIVQDVDALASYPWTGHRELVAPTPAPLIATGVVLGWFAPEPRAAAEALCAWMASPAEPAPTATEARPDPALLRRAIEHIVAEAAGARGVDPREVFGGSRRRPVSAARAEAVLRLHERLELPLARIERALGLSRGAADRALRRARTVRHH